MGYNKGMAEVGRPSKYNEEYNEQVEKLARLGATDKEMADFFNVTEQTLNNWKTSKCGFFESLKKGKILADANVTDSLYRRALGYEHMEDKIFNNGGEALVIPTIKHYPPDPTACIFWLKNRRQIHWREKQEVNLSTDKPLSISIEVVETDEDK